MIPYQINQYHVLVCIRYKPQGSAPKASQDPCAVPKTVYSRVASSSLYTYNTNPSYTYNQYSLFFYNYSSGSLCSRFSLFVWDFRIQEKLSISRASHPFCIQKHYSGVQLQSETYGWTFRSYRIQSRPSNTCLSHRGAEQGEEAHVSGAEAHVTVPKTRKFAAEVHVYAQRRTWLYRGARLCTEAPRLSWWGARLCEGCREAPVSVAIRRTPLRRGARLIGPDIRYRTRNLQKNG